MNTRIKEVRKSVGLSMQEFGKRLGISSPSVSKIENGINNPSEQTIRAICSEFNINRDWLELGIGEMQHGNEQKHADMLHTLRRFPRTLDALINMTDEELTCLEGFLTRYFDQKQK